MKRTVEVTYSNSAKINTGNYEQESPMYSMKSILECANGDSVDERTESLRLKSIVDPLLADHIRSVKGIPEHLRIRDRDGKKYPSVTSILYSEPYKGDPALGEIGQEAEDIIHEYVLSGKWREPTCHLNHPRWQKLHYRELIEREWPTIESAAWQLEVFHERLAYSGKIDVLCNLGSELTILDIKSGTYHWEQLAAYQHCLLPMPTQLAVLDLQKCELVTATDTQVTTAWESFLMKRGEFKERFGL